MQLAAQGCLIANHMGGLYGSVDYHQSHTTRHHYMNIHMTLPLSLSLSLSLSLARSLARSLCFPLVYLTLL
jgi:hypothetical protein